jgi:hypothetical protein
MLRKALRPLLVLIEAVLLAWGVLFLAEYLGWRVVREAGGSAVVGGPVFQARCGTTL